MYTEQIHTYTHNTHCHKELYTHAEVCSLFCNITSPTKCYSPLAIQLWLCNVKRYLLFVANTKKEYAGTCQLKKLRDMDNLAIPNIAHSKEMQF